MICAEMDGYGKSKIQMVFRLENKVIYSLKMFYVYQEPSPIVHMFKPAFFTLSVFKMDLASKIQAGFLIF